MRLWNIILNQPSWSLVYASENRMDNTNIRPTAAHVMTHKFLLFMAVVLFLAVFFQLLKQHDFTLKIKQMSHNKTENEIYHEKQLDEVKGSNEQFNNVKAKQK